MIGRHREVDGLMSKSMNDMIIKLYELNEHYHDTKEKMAWLGSSLYFTFSLAIMRFLFVGKAQTIIKNHSKEIVVFLLAIFICALLFVYLQYRKKRISVGITGESEGLMAEPGSFDENHLTQLLKVKSDIHTNFKKYKEKDKKGYRKIFLRELPIYFLMIIFFIFQIILLWFKSKC